MKLTDDQQSVLEDRLDVTRGWRAQIAAADRQLEETLAWRKVAGEGYEQSLVALDEFFKEAAAL